MSNHTTDHTKLPIRRPPFQGVVKRTLDGSEPDWGYVAPLAPPDDAPNILLILTDDAGFGNPATFGARSRRRRSIGWRRMKKSVAQIDGASAKELKAALAQAQAGMGGA